MTELLSSTRLVEQLAEGNVRYIQRSVKHLNVGLLAYKRAGNNVLGQKLHLQNLLDNHLPNNITEIRAGKATVRRSMLRDCERTSSHIFTPEGIEVFTRILHHAVYPKKKWKNILEGIKVSDSIVDQINVRVVVPYLKSFLSSPSSSQR